MELRKLIGEHLQPLLMRSREAANFIAVCDRKLWSLTNDGLIPCVRIGRSVRYDRRDLVEFIDKVKSGEIKL